MVVHEPSRRRLSVVVDEPSQRRLSVVVDEPSPCWLSVVVDEPSQRRLSVVVHELALSKMVLALLSCFHGPQIEGSFSIMGNVITTQTACMGIKTLDAIQSVKYSLKASEKTAVQYFKKNDHLHSSVDSKLVCNMTCAHKKYYAELDIVKKQRDAKKAKLHIAKEKAQTNQNSKEVNINAARNARKVYIKALLTKLATSSEESLDSVALNEHINMFCHEHTMLHIAYIYIYI